MVSQFAIFLARFIASFRVWILATVKTVCKDVVYLFLMHGLHLPAKFTDIFT